MNEQNILNVAYRWEFRAWLEAHLIVSDAAGFYHLAASTAFDVNKPILYCATTLEAAATGSNKRSGEKAVFPMKWGFSGCTLLMNARTETAPVKATFRDAWASHRCIVPASWYFEWEHIVGNDGKKRTGDKYLIQPKGSAMTWLCGLYRIEDGLPVFVILTREPGEEIRFIHDRMPLIMPRDYVDEWIRPDAKPEELVQAAMTEMVFEKVSSTPAKDNVQMSML